MAFVQAIGKTMFHGFAGSYSRQPDTIIDTHPLGGADIVPFGQAVAADAAGTLAKVSGSTTAADILGIALRETKSATDYLNQSVGSYAPGDAVPVLKRGCANVFCQNGTPAYDGAVYVRIAANASYPNAVIGGFEAVADGGNTIELTNFKWKGAADVNGIAELRILTATHA